MNPTDPNSTVPAVDPMAQVAPAVAPVGAMAGEPAMPEPAMPVVEPVVPVAAPVAETPVTPTV